MKKKHLAAAAVLGIVGMSGLSAASAASSQTVGEQNVSRQAEDTAPLKPWVVYTRVATPGVATFRDGPATPPAGTGSLELATAGGSDKVYVFNFDHVGTPLSAVSDIAYSTYRSAGSAQQVAALNLQVDSNGAEPGGFTTLVFEPVYNTDQGAVVSNQWQSWDAYRGGNAIWWSSNPIPGAPNRDTFVSWSSIVAANPNAVVTGGVGVNQGSGNPGLTTSVDAFTFDQSTYDFENLSSPTTKDDCKKDGWMRFNSPTFKNQGDCVSYVANGK